MDRDNGQKTLDATYDKTKRATSEGRKVECPLFFIMNIKKEFKLWFFLRIIIIIFAFISGVSNVVENNNQVKNIIKEFDTIYFIMLLVVLIITPIIIFTVITLVEPLTCKTWRKPSMKTCFLNFNDPLNFVHLGAIFGISLGCGECIAQLFVKGNNYFSGIYTICIGFSIIYVLKKLMKKYKHKYKNI
jgi:hypothetical protein